VLGLPAQAGLTDDEVRSAWRRVATATHPDRADGGDPPRFAAAAAAYTALRTQFGRAEALADLARSGRPSRPRPGGAVPGRWWSRVRRGRPARLALRIAVAAAASLAVVLAAGARPATPALITGVLTWLVLTGRRDLAPPNQGSGESGQSLAPNPRLSSWPAQPSPGPVATGRAGSATQFDQDPT
jgi:curved DNA-binding protein CbpA